MTKLINKDKCEPNTWQKITALEDSTDLNQGCYLVPLAVFEELSQDSAFDSSRIGLWVNGDSELETIKPFINTATVIAIEFPAFADGRGFSLARMIREYLEYSGELRATGNFIQDQLFYLSRCGFDTFEVPDDADIDSYRQSLSDFTECYQAAVDEPQPLFRRRA